MYTPAWGSNARSGRCEHDRRDALEVQRAVARDGPGRRALQRGHEGRLHVIPGADTGHLRGDERSERDGLAVDPIRAVIRVTAAVPRCRPGVELEGGHDGP